MRCSFIQICPDDVYLINIHREEGSHYTDLGSIGVALNDVSLRSVKWSLVCDIFYDMRSIVALRSGLFEGMAKR